MADNVFRVEVGAQIAASTERLKKDIQSILNEISKTPPEVTISANKSKSRAAIKKNLEDMFKGNSSVGVTLGLKGGSNLRGSTGQAIKKDLAGITKTLSDQQVAKVTMHIDTTATQKAMLAELKKLDLGVVITAKDGSDTQRQKDLAEEKRVIKEMADLRLEQYRWEQRATKSAEGSRAKAYAQAKADSYKTQYEDRGKEFLQTDAAKRLKATSAALDDEVGALRRVNDASESAGNAIEIVADRTEKANARIQKSNAETVQKKRDALFKDAATVQKNIYNTQAQLAKINQNDANYKMLTGRLNRYQEMLLHLKEKANRDFGLSDDEFDKEVAGYEKTARAAEDYAKAVNDAAKAEHRRTGKQDEAVLDNERRAARIVEQHKLKLNEAASNASQYSNELDMLEEALNSGVITFEQFGFEIGKWSQRAKDAGAMAESVGEKFSRMLGEKIGYGAIALALRQVINGLRQIYTNVVEIDTGMTELKKVTDETDQVYSKFLDNAAVRAKQLGATISDTVNATASFARLGYSLDEAAQLADAAVVYNHVGDEIESIDDASNSVISTMQAFGIEAENVMSIVDKFNTIGKQNCPAA